MFARCLSASIGLSLTATTCWAEGAVGFSPFMLDAPHHNKPVETAIWYPADTGGTQVTLMENAVFHGTTVQEDAPIREGQYPVVLLSHGLGGNFYAMGWLAAGLAERGAIVITVNHPNSTTRDFDIRAGLDHWTRAHDLRLALDYLQMTYGEQLDMTRVMAAGFSYGGWSALSLAGVTGNLDGYIAHCAEVGAVSTHCADIARGGVDMADISENDWNASYKDARITAVAAIDPGLLYGLSAGSTDDLTTDILLIGLGNDTDRLFATDFTPKGNDFAARVPTADIVTITLANHFSALLTCKPAGAAILKSENDDPVCDDPEGADRSAIHGEILDAIAVQLGL